MNRMHAQMQDIAKEDNSPCSDFPNIVLERRKDNDIVTVPQPPRNVECMSKQTIQFVQIHRREHLTGQVSDRKPPPLRNCKE